MKSTLRQQAAAVIKARKKHPYIDDAYGIALNDAAVTLNALRLIGEDVVLIAPELVTKVKAFLKAYNDRKPVRHKILEIRDVINRLK